MPELVHDCGKRVRFPSGTEGRRGRCPHCGGSLTVPHAGENGLAPPPKVELDPPPDWDEYLAYLQDRGPPPRPTIMPHKLMLQAEADEKWERQAEVRPSRFSCPSCRARINMDQVICTGCGVDFRTGYTVDRSARLNEKGLAYLEQIPWLDQARRELDDDGDDDGGGDKPRKVSGKVPRARKRRLG